VRLEIPKAPQVYRFARPEFSHDDPWFRVISAGCEVSVHRITAEIDELADYVLNIGP
jgi:hypothetical protein